MKWIVDGEKETVPEDCPAELKDVITACWDTPDKRPSMAVALTRLQRWQQPKGAAPISDLFASTQQRKLAPGEAAVAADLSYGGNQGSYGSGLPVRR